MDQRLFVCHASADSKRVDEIVQKIELLGVKCWVAPRDVPEGGVWSEEIEEAILKSSSILLILSQSSNNSKHVSREVASADKKNKNILPARIDNSTPGSKISFYIANLQILDLTHPEKDDETLRHAISAQAGVMSTDGEETGANVDSQATTSDKLNSDSSTAMSYFKSFFEFFEENFKSIGTFLTILVFLYLHFSGKASDFCMQTQFLYCNYWYPHKTDEGLTVENAKWDKQKLHDLTSTLKSDTARAKAVNYVKIIDGEEADFENRRNTVSGLTTLIRDCVACNIKQKAQTQIETLTSVETKKVADLDERGLGASLGQFESDKAKTAAQNKLKACAQKSDELGQVAANDRSGLQNFIKNTSNKCAAYRRANDLLGKIDSQPPKPPAPPAAGARRGYVVLHMLRPDGSSYRTYFSGQGGDGGDLPVPGGVIVATPPSSSGVRIWNRPYRYDVQTGRIADPTGELGEVKTNQRAVAAGDIRIASEHDAAGNVKWQYVIAEISDLPDGDPAILTSDFMHEEKRGDLNYVFLWAVNFRERKRKENSENFSFVDDSRGSALFPARRDVLIARKQPLNLRKSIAEHAKASADQLNIGDRVRIVGDAVIRNGKSVWAPVERVR